MTDHDESVERLALADGTLGDDDTIGQGLRRLVAVMARLRRDCPWDAEQTHRSLVKHLIEETAEAIDAIEADSGDDTDLVEELGDVLLQVVFHAEIARGGGRFNIDTVANVITDKLIARHPYVFGDADTPDDMMVAWEGAKRVEKQRQSALDGMAESLPSLARAAKVATRLRDIHAADQVDVTPPASAGTEDYGDQLLAVIWAAVQNEVDPDQALRDATRAWEEKVRQSEV